MEIIEGIDVSMVGQGKHVDWSAQKKAGTVWASPKIGQGNGFVDPAYRTNIAGCRQNGILIMPYFFLAHDNPAEDQAAELLALLDRPNNSDLLLPALDVEPDPNSTHALFSRTGGCYGTSYTPAHMVKLVDDVLTFVRDGAHGHKGLGVNLTLYSYPYWWRTYMGDTHNYGKACPLWAAVYPGPPHEPVGWGGWDYYTFHQYTSNGSVAGLHVDRDRFKGSLDDLKKFANY